MGLLAQGGMYYPLCDGCAPRLGESVREVAFRCRASGAVGINAAVYPIPRFGFNEPAESDGHDG